MLENKRQKKDEDLPEKKKRKKENGLRKNVRKTIEKISTCLKRTFKIVQESGFCDIEDDVPFYIYTKRKGYVIIPQNLSLMYVIDMFIENFHMLVIDQTDCQRITDIFLHLLCMLIPLAFTSLFKITLRSGAVSLVSVRISYVLWLACTKVLTLLALFHDGDIYGKEKLASALYILSQMALIIVYNFH